MKKDRELSQIEFFCRLLSLAENREFPLGERLKFLVLFDHSVAEFFMVRYPKILVKKSSKQQKKIINNIREAVDRRNQIGRIVLKELAQKQIEILPMQTLTDAQKQKVFQELRYRILPYLTYVSFDESHGMPIFYHEEFNMGVVQKNKEKPAIHLMRVPEFISPILSVEEGKFIPTYEAILWNYSRIYPPKGDIFFFRVTRNYRFRKRSNFQAGLCSDLPKTPDITSVFLYPAHRKEYQKMLRDTLRYEGPIFPMAYPYDPHVLEAMYHQLPSHLLKEPMTPFYKREEHLFFLLRRQDLLLYHPYDSFQTVIDFLEQACRDPQVLAIKQTLYRVTDSSPIVENLVIAAKRGKEVVVVIEPYARFEEERNYKMILRLKEAGAQVICGYQKHKVHAKMTVVIRREDTPIYYTHVGTGNYHEKNAKEYTDISLLTANQSLGEEIDRAFQWLCLPDIKPNFTKIGVTFCGLAAKIEEKIQRCEQSISEGKKASIFIKVNGLSDKKTIDCLQKAAKAGVEIVLMVRGICTWVPEETNVRIYSLMGRFLEHSRLYQFTIEREDTLYISSADLMPRNLYRRVELLCPVEDNNAKQKIKELIQNLMQDTQNLWQLQKNGEYHSVKGTPFCAQEYEIEKRKPK